MSDNTTWLCDSEKWYFNMGLPYWTGPDKARRRPSSSLDGVQYPHKKGPAYQEGDDDELREQAEREFEEAGPTQNPRDDHLLSLMQGNTPGTGIFFHMCLLIINFGKCN